MTADARTLRAADKRSRVAHLVVDVAVLTVRQGRLGVLVGRDHDAHGGWGLPSSPVADDEVCDTAAERVLLLQAAAVSGRDTMFLEQLRTYSEVPESEDAVRRVSVAYVALLADVVLPQSSTALHRVFDVDDLLDTGVLPHDHGAILADAIERVRAKLEYTTVATSLVTEPFTIPELRRVYESVWGVALHPANFRRKVLATPAFVRPELVRSTASDPADARRGPDLYRRGAAVLLHPAMLRPQPDA